MATENGALQLLLAHKPSHSHNLRGHSADGYSPRVGLQARSMAPAIIFIDEIDAVGRVRSSEKGTLPYTLNHFDLYILQGFQGSRVRCMTLLEHVLHNKSCSSPPGHSAHGHRY